MAVLSADGTAVCRGCGNAIQVVDPAQVDITDPTAFAPELSHHDCLGLETDPTLAAEDGSVKTPLEPYVAPAGDTAPEGGDTTGETPAAGETPLAADGTETPAPDAAPAQPPDAGTA